MHNETQSSFTENMIGLSIPEGITAVIGSGGKTSFLRYLASILPGPVILSTSTHMRPYEGIPLLLTPQQDSMAKQGNTQSQQALTMQQNSTAKQGDTQGRQALTEQQNSAANQGNMQARKACGEEEILKEVKEMLAENRLLCMGTPMYSRDGSVITKLSAPAISFEKLLPYARYILVEADGSRNRPLKAHRSFEPVIPESTALTVCMIGASGLGKPISESVHCPDIFCRLTGADPEAPADAASIAMALNKENLADHYVINQADVVNNPEELQLMCSLIQKPVSILSLKELAAQAVEKR